MGGVVVMMLTVKYEVDGRRCCGGDVPNDVGVGSLPSPILLADNSCSLLFFRLIMIIYSLILSTKLFRNSPETDVNTDPNYANFVPTEHS